MGLKKVSIKKFIEISKEVHENKYDYSLVEDYKTVKDKVKIICPKHGEFIQDVYSHKKGCGCPTCGIEYVANLKYKSLDHFLEKVKQIHGDLYNYDKTVIVNNSTKVIITCKIHGDFEQSPDKHKQGRECPHCCLDSKGWSKESWGKLKKYQKPLLYILKCYNETESFIKIGKTKNSVKKRYSGKNSMPYNYEVLKIITFPDPDYIFDLEISYKRNFKDFRYKPTIYFRGETECFDITQLENIICAKLTT